MIWLGFTIDKCVIHRVQIWPSHIVRLDHFKVAHFCIFTHTHTASDNEHWHAHMHGVLSFSFCLLQTIYISYLLCFCFVFLPLTLFSVCGSCLISYYQRFRYLSQIFYELMYSQFGCFANKDKLHIAVKFVYYSCFFKYC